MQMVKTYLFRAFLALGLMALSSCIFKTGIPMVEEEVLTQNNKTWQFTITKLTPPTGFQYMSSDNSITIRVSNSFDITHFGTVTILEEPSASGTSSPLTLTNGVNCTMSYRNGSLPNDTLVINKQAGSTLPLQESYIYRNIKLEGFKDFKGNKLEAIIEAEYNFKAINNNPYFLSMVPAHGNALFNQPISLTFNKEITDSPWGKLILSSYNANVQSVTLNADSSSNANAQFKFHTSIFPKDTVIITPNAGTIPANRYTVKSIEGFKDINGNSMSTVPVSPTNTEYTIDVYGKLAEYKFNGNLYDSSKNHYNLSFPTTAEPAFFQADRKGIDGSALKFKGTEEILTNEELQQINNLRDNQTITLWFAPEIMTGIVDMPLFSKVDGTGGSGYETVEIQLEIFENSGKHYLRAIIGDTTPGFISVSSTTELTSAVWYHAAVIVKNTTLMLYLNGTQQGQKNLPFGKERIIANAASLIIGRSNITSTKNYKGLIDDFTIYNYPLSEDEIIADYNNSK